MAVNILALLAAMVIYAYFSDCNPIQMKRITKTDEYLVSGDVSVTNVGRSLVYKLPFCYF